MPTTFEVYAVIGGKRVDLDSFDTEREAEDHATALRQQPRAATTIHVQRVERENPEG